uniref:Uncharacterized protein n=1 Tax=Globisporangium ultimum (strain ATCC 200006 / CBS 805.95 / DAOM BR144) TaxID=431595 RepID=K3WDT3_GLOUD
MYIAAFTACSSSSSTACSCGSSQHSSTIGTNWSQSDPTSASSETPSAVWNAIAASATTPNATIPAPTEDVRASSLRALCRRCSNAMTSMQHAENPRFHVTSSAPSSHACRSATLRNTLSATVNALTRIRAMNIDDDDVSAVLCWYTITLAIAKCSSIVRAACVSSPSNMFIARHAAASSATTARCAAIPASSSHWRHGSSSWSSWSSCFSSSSSSDAASDLVVSWFLLRNTSRRRSA